MSTPFDPKGTVFESFSPIPSLKPKKRGFAALTPERRREIASQGGRAAHASGKAHQFTSEEARAAGSKRHKSQQETFSLGDLAHTHLLRDEVPK